jgi:hypothetical protein
LLLASADRLDAALMLDLHLATAAARIAGTLELPVLVDLPELPLELDEAAGAADELDEELLLPQPANSAPPTATIATSEQSLLIMDPPVG